MNEEISISTRIAVAAATLAVMGDGFGYGYSEAPPSAEFKEKCDYNHRMKCCRAGYTRKSRFNIEKSKLRASRKAERNRRGR